MLTVAHRVESGGRAEERLVVEHCGARTLAIVADGAGGMGGGAIAAEMTCSLVTQRMRSGRVGTPEDWERCLFDVDCALGWQGSGGQGTAAIAEISEGRVTGAAVGDSGVWMLRGGEIVDLTEHQHRKPLLGSGEASPVGFGPNELSGRLLLATDGLFKYATRHNIAQWAKGLTVNDAID